MLNNSFREMSTAGAQFYDIYDSYLKYFPGPHTKIYDFLEGIRLFIAKRVKKNQETLDPNVPRDFIDCFLIQMEKVNFSHLDASSTDVLDCMSHNTQTEKPFDPTYFLSRAVSNVICSIVFGDRFDYEDKDFQALMEMLNNSFREMSTAWAQAREIDDKEEGDCTSYLHDEDCQLHTASHLFGRSSLSLQFYDIYDSYLKYFPGPHTKIDDFLEGIRLFIAKKVKKNQETLDPNVPRDFIDCFLIQMEKVSYYHFQGGKHQEFDCRGHNRNRGGTSVQ
ncbi:hypothetical protein JD844_005850 [Phrynosoma platyrhinos]|uniref:Uncharacterized protein n=1 Tax=Phrynosoma platyrhinos TaxID=52577 RepID=A0ABQ7TQ56_PHRPL|nr:hypothetical protein JD844_005850 [Phrynosoma platyrhinos]